MKRIGFIKKKFLTTDLVEEAIESLTTTAKRNKWTPTMKRNWARILDNREEVVKRIYDQLNSQSYEFHPFTKFIRFENKKKREIYASCPEDQIVDYILDVCLKYIFMEKKRIIHPHSYGSIKGKGQHQLRKIIIDKVHKLGDVYVAICDTKKYYPTIKHDIMMKFLRQHIKDVWVLWLCEATTSRMKPDEGMALGLASSNILGHVYHSAIDWTMTVKYGMRNYYRFCDDKVMINKDKKYLHDMVRVLRDLITDVGQTMKPNWKVVRCKKQRFEFLGALIGTGGAILKTTARRRIERRFKKEEKREFTLERDYMRVLMTWAGIRGGLRDVKINGLIKYWVLHQFPVFFTRLRLAMELIDERKARKHGTVITPAPKQKEKIQVPSATPYGVYGKDYFHWPSIIPTYTENEIKLMPIRNGWGDVILRAGGSVTEEDLCGKQDRSQ